GEVEGRGVAEQRLLPDCGKENVYEPVVVETPGRHSLSVYRLCQPGGRSDIAESSVLIVVIERHHRIDLLRRVGKAGRIDQQYVLPAVIVVIEKRAAGTVRFGQILFTECTLLLFQPTSALH